MCVIIGGFARLTCLKVFTNIVTLRVEVIHKNINSVFHRNNFYMLLKRGQLKAANRSFMPSSSLHQFSPRTKSFLTTTVS